MTMVSLSQSKMTLSKEDEHNLKLLSIANEFVLDLTSKCFDKCVPKIQERTSKPELLCMNHCAARFFDVQSLVHQRYNELAKSEE